MRVALMHLPKTGGTTLHDLLLPNFQKDAVCPERFNNFDRFSDEDLNSYKFFSAHMDFRNLSRVSSSSYTITLLRDPKQRILSLYYFWKAQTRDHIDRHDMIGPRRAKDMPLREFLEDLPDFLRKDFDNVYVRNLIGPLWTGRGGALMLQGDDALRIAMRNLLKIDEVGFTTEISDLIKRVFSTLKVDPPVQLPRSRAFENFGQDDPNTEKVEKEEITPEIDALLDELTFLDRQLYESARILLEKRGSSEDK